ncbi:hypothetical protein Kpol_1054p48 [Vanderwaltozyma polyspora DSM 70294]|uniref:BHLH domain-containing protein n=1 Tax=Vanderwaltozyma polyspora (strain ATCC 22028 / DSM 70294 / BCRC 21397 / CBS 2163 / NBRC 10782 / NRRL Y-8283 / UCD 57-17) TaxID=436907 RepID=A7TID5_VANPO|nr:uncharacterized protein Kpol_1054p48 [Vanderwaltozyma polyspora DSM 70294]EDO18001.1 hypothetical protein Kpol_1054p48 [Vanderwaltozyma polyspora DSM 70294]
MQKRHREFDDANVKRHKQEIMDEGNIDEALLNENNNDGTAVAAAVAAAATAATEANTNSNYDDDDEEDVRKHNRSHEDIDDDEDKDPDHVPEDGDGDAEEEEDDAEGRGGNNKRRHKSEEAGDEKNLGSNDDDETRSNREQEEEEQHQAEHDHDHDHDHNNDIASQNEGDEANADESGNGSDTGGNSVSALVRRAKKATPATGSAEWKQQRKDSHKEVERRRRENINMAINKLSDLLPVKESSKAAILSRAAEYIQKLKETENANIEKWTLQKLLSEQNASQLTSANEKLQEELGNAYKEIEVLKTKVKEFEDK